jgi:hypothetical protein
MVKGAGDELYHIFRVQSNRLPSQPNGRRLENYVNLAKLIIGSVTYCRIIKTISYKEGFK